VLLGKFVRDWGRENAKKKAIRPVKLAGRRLPTTVFPGGGGCGHERFPFDWQLRTKRGYGGGDQ